MADIAAGQVKALREKTGAGMMDCKKALVEAAGDGERALELLRERGLAQARGKAGRTTSDGLIVASVSDDARQAILLEINCETDFVARTEPFQEFCAEVADMAREKGVSDVDTLLSLPQNSGTVRERVDGAIAKLGENIQLRRLTRLESGAQGCVASYIHAGGKIGTLVAVEADDPKRAEVRALARNLCMHIAATNPMSVSREGIPALEVEKERSVLRKQAEGEGKPANVLEKMVEGRLNKFFKEVVLLEQPLVMDPDRTVEAAVKQASARVVGMRRFQLGEEGQG